jgi:hypothetical protein
MSEAELGAYCRQKGLYPEQVQRWKEACLHGTGLQEGQEKTAQKQQRDARKTIKKLKAEVRRKDRVLAETTSLLVLSKKLEALYGEDPDSEDNWVANHRYWMKVSASILGKTAGAKK